MKLEQGRHAEDQERFTPPAAIYCMRDDHVSKRCKILWAFCFVLFFFEGGFLTFKRGRVLPG